MELNSIEYNKHTLIKIELATVETVVDSVPVSPIAARHYLLKEQVSYLVKGNASLPFIEKPNPKPRPPSLDGTPYENPEVIEDNEEVSPISTQTFAVPFVRVDTGRTVFMPASITNGEFAIELTFKTSGKWVVNAEMINAELPELMFYIDDYSFQVI